MTQFIATLTPDPTDARDYIFEWDETAIVPAHVDLREYTGMVENQFGIGSCTANATVSACEMFLIANGFYVDTVATEAGDLSRLFNYYGSRHSIGGRFADSDIGSIEREALRVARNQGLCAESTWPYVSEKWNDKPSDAAYAEALTMKLGAYYRITMTAGAPTYASTNPIGQIKYALAQGYPVLVGMLVGEKIRTWRAGDHYSYAGTPANPYIGGHEMLIVGYDGEDAIVENSWGTEWGDNGYFRYPLRVIENDGIDLWVVKGFAGYERVGPDVTITVPKDPREVLARNAYRDMLHREPEAAGLAHWMSLLAGGMTHAEMRRHIAGSGEFLTLHTTVESLYRDILLREPDAGGLAAWQTTGLTIYQIIPGFTLSTEFAEKFK